MFDLYVKTLSVMCQFRHLILKTMTKLYILQAGKETINACKICYRDFTIDIFLVCFEYCKFEHCLKYFQHNHEYKKMHVIFARN